MARRFWGVVICLLALCAFVLAGIVSAEPVQVTVAHWWGNQFDPVFEAFQQEHPEIQLVVEARPYSGYHDKLLLESASGVGPEIYFVDAYFFGQFFRQGAFRDLTDYITRDNLDLSKFAGSPALEMGYEGKIYAFPMWFPDNQNVYVNKELAEEAGVVIPEWGTPQFDTWRWDDFRRAAKKLTRVGADNQVSQWGIENLGGGFVPANFFVWQNGGELFREINHINETETLIDREPAIEAFDFLASLILEDRVAPLPSQGPGAATWLSGKAGFYLGWNTLYWYEQAPFEWTLIPIPWQTRRVTKVGGNSWAMNKNTPNDEAAWVVLKWLTTSPTALQLFAKIGSLTSFDPRRNVLPYADGKQRLLWATLLERASGDVEFRPWWFGSKNVPAVLDELNRAADNILNGREPARSALALAARTINAIINE
jgi:multiple sugar transport system substrate-binding protein